MSAELAISVEQQLAAHAAIVQQLIAVDRWHAQLVAELRGVVAILEARIADLEAAYIADRRAVAT